MSDPDGRWVNIAIGAGIGAVLGAGIEGWKQVATGDFNAGRLGAAAAGGAVAGGIAGATMGLSLIAEGGAAATVGVVGASSAAGGSTTRALMGEEVSAGTVATDAVVGVATFGVLKGAGTAAEALHPTFKPGPYAGESISARSTAQKFNATERAETNRIGQSTGCHTCGTTNPGTKSGNFVPDHQPVSSLNTKGAPQQLYPQCINCSREQGLAAARAIRNQE